MRYVWLVINLSKAEKYLLAPFAEKYKVFEDHDGEAMIAHARSIGWDDFLGFGINARPGMANVHQCGDAHVMIMRTEVHVTPGLQELIQAP